MQSPIRAAAHGHRNAVGLQVNLLSGKESGAIDVLTASRTQSVFSAHATRRFARMASGPNGLGNIHRSAVDVHPVYIRGVGDTSVPSHHGRDEEVHAPRVARILLAPVTRPIGE
jgi:hypothetical protein